VIEHLNFSDVYTAINALAINDVVVQHNTMQPQRVGVFSRRSSNWTVAYNKIDNRSALRPFRNSGIVNQVGSGWTVVHNEIVGTFLGVVLAGSALSRPTDNTISFNHIEGGCCDGAGIDFTAQDGTVITNNDISVPTSTDAVGSVYCGANGILVADASGLAAINSTIVNNDTRPTQVGVLIALDVNGNTGNAEGLLMRGNFGTLALNQSIDSCTSGAITGVVKNRSISSEITCDEDGACTEP
jgi:nitrous oxidase accessory protein NosD